MPLTEEMQWTAVLQTESESQNRQSSVAETMESVAVVVVAAAAARME